MRKIKVSIIIVHYRNEQELYDCITSIKRSTPETSYEIIVVDNDERKTIGPTLKKKFGWVKYLKAPGDVGYGAGNNLGAKEARGEYLFILNPDTKVPPGAIDTLVTFLEKRKKTAIVAPNLIDAKGKVFIQLGSGKLTPLRGIVALSFLNKIFPNNPISRGYWLKGDSIDKVREVDVVPGSAFLVRKEVFDELKGFDETFFLYFEESDFCKRVKEVGWKIFITPDAQITHYWGKSTPNSEENKKILTKSRFYYFKKHYGIFSALLVETFARFSKRKAIFILVFILVLVIFNIIRKYI